MTSTNEDKFWETVKQNAANPQPTPPMPEPTQPTLQELERDAGFDPADQS